MLAPRRLREERVLHCRRGMRPAALPEVRPSPPRPVRGKSVSLDELLPGLGDDALAGGDAGLDGGLDAIRDLRDLLRHDVVAALGLALDGADLTVEAPLAATDDALGARAHLAGLRLAATLEAAQRDAATRRQGLDDARGDGGDAVTRLHDGTDVHQAGALGDVAALLGRRLGGASVGLRGLAGLVLGGAARATTGRLRRRLACRRAVGRARRGGARSGRARRVARGALARGAAALGAVAALGGALGVAVRGGGHVVIPSRCFPE